MKYVSILGSTGSIGCQAIEVAARNRDKYSIVALTAFNNDLLIEKQIELVNPDIAVLVDKDAADRLVRRYHGRTRILTGEEGLIEAAVDAKVDTVLSSLVGFAGLKPTLAAINAGKNIALANKETLVAAGDLVTKAARENNVNIIPVDSEHSALLQCMQGENRNKIKRLILTASGGPFRGYKAEQLENVTVEQCLKHPNWAMGKKITVDSATLANKGLEVIEAKWLFDVDYSQIEVVVHPQSIIHSMVEYSDGSVVAQMGMPDMRLPIQYALSYPDRNAVSYSRLEFNKIKALTFEEPDTETFLALPLAYKAGGIGGTMPCVFNAANEVAVYSFLRGEIRFVDIYGIISSVMDNHQTIFVPRLEDIYQADAWARRIAQEFVKSFSA